MPDVEPRQPEQQLINFPKLRYIAVGLLGYSRRESRFLSLDELLSQYQAFCEIHGIRTEERSIADEFA